MCVKFFIIIPIYNVEMYLNKCLDSLIAQTYKNFEAIMIDDGSTDKSLKIAQEYTKKDSRFFLQSQENQGLSITRNRAIHIAQQKAQLETNSVYLSFLDSDDYLQSNALETYYNIIYHYSPSIILSDCLFFVYPSNKEKESVSNYLPLQPSTQNIFNAESLAQQIQGGGGLIYGTTLCGGGKVFIREQNHLYRTYYPRG